MSNDRQEIIRLSEQMTRLELQDKENTKEYKQLEAKLNKAALERKYKGYNQPFYLGQEINSFIIS